MKRLTTLNHFSFNFRYRNGITYHMHKLITQDVIVLIFLFCTLCCFYLVSCQPADLLQIALI